MRLLKNPRVRLPKNPIRARNYECNNAETNPESPKPNGMPAQLRFCTSDFFLQVTAFTFKLSNLLVFFAEFFFQRLTLQICAKWQFQLLADLEIVLQHPWIVLFDFFSGNFESRCNDVKIVAGPYVPCLTLSSRPHRASKKGIENERKKKSSFHISSLLRIRLLLDSKRLAGR